MSFDGRNERIKTMTTSTVNRRQLLNAMGLGASTLFLPSLMGDKRAYAAGVPKKLLVFYTPHGPVQQRWQMRSGGPAQWTADSKNDRASETSFSLANLPEASWSEILKPLYPHRSKLLVMEGLAYTSAFCDTIKNAHNAGTAHALTGAKQVLNGGPFAQGGGGDSSIDQIIADTIADKDRVRNLYLTTGGWSPVYRGTTEQRGETNAIKAFDRLFPVGKVGDPLLDRVKERRANALAAVKTEYEAITKKLSGEDKTKLQTHFDLVNELQKSLVYRSNEGVKCAARPARYTTTGNEVATVDQFAQMITAAFACDMTRVATLALGTLSQGDAKTILNVDEDMHLTVAHAANSQNPTRMMQMATYYKYFATQFANIMTKLDAVKVDGDKSILDNTACVWLCELANGPHDFHDVLAVIGGSAGGYFNTGRYVKFAETNSRGNAKFGPAHSKLLVSVQQAMGVQKDTVGLADGMVDGKAMDLKGPLPMLKV